jgi:RNA polymerase sigma-70 factor (ECF subfamily)
VWNQREKLAEVESFPNWLFILGRNQLLSEIRKKILSTAEIAPETHHLPDDLMLPDQQYELRQTYQVIMQGVSRLSEQQKTAFTLSRLEGLTYEEVAEKMGISKRTVRFHMVLALNALREYAREKGIYQANLLFLLLLARY